MNYPEIRPQLCSGDLLLCAGTSWFSRLIQAATGSEWSHVGLILRLDALDRVMLLESSQTKTLYPFGLSLSKSRPLRAWPYETPPIVHPVRSRLADEVEALLREIVLAHFLPKRHLLSWKFSYPNRSIRIAEKRMNGNLEN